MLVYLAKSWSELGPAQPQLVLILFSCDSCSRSPPVPFLRCIISLYMKTLYLIFRDMSTSCLKVSVHTKTYINNTSCILLIVWRHVDKVIEDVFVSYHVVNVSSNMSSAVQILWKQAWKHGVNTFFFKAWCKHIRKHGKSALTNLLNMVWACCQTWYEVNMFSYRRGIVKVF